mgnify:CR=1 FL=1
MLSIIIKEFVAVCGYLEKMQDGQRTDFLIIDREKLEQLLDRNRYLPAQEKLKIWKTLHWIDTDQGHLTRRILVNGKYVRKVKICGEIYREIQRLIDK